VNGKEVRLMRECKVDEKTLGRWVERAESEIWFISPAITEPLARNIIEADKRTGENSRVLITLDDAMDRHGYGETKGARLLMNEGKNIKHAEGILISALVIKHDICVVWTPIAERVDSIDRVTFNGFLFEQDEEMEEFQYRIQQIMQMSPSQSDENHSYNSEISKEHYYPQFDSSYDHPMENNKKLKVVDVTEEAIEEVEKNLVEHPPRNYKEEKELEVYSSYLGFIEIQLTGSSLAKSTTLSIPKELTEIGLDKDLRRLLSERMQIDLSDSVDLGVKKVNKLVEAFREIFTKKMKKPLGRIYLKKDWEIMKRKSNEINKLIEEVNKDILNKIEDAVNQQIEDAAKKWFESRYSTTSNKSTHLTKDQIIELLKNQWVNHIRPKKVKLDLFPKDLTWETLNDEEVKKTIEEEFPDIRDTGLYKTRIAHS